MSDTPISPAAGAVAATGYGSTQSLVGFFITPAAVAIALAGIANPLIIGTGRVPAVGAVAATAGSAPSQSLANVVPTGSLSTNGNSPVQSAQDAVPVAALTFSGVAPLIGNGGIAGTSGRLFITEFESLTKDRSSGALLVHMPALVYQVAAFAGSYSVSSPFGPGTHIVRLQSDVPCLVQISKAPSVAAGNGMRISSGQTEYFAVNPGDSVAVIVSS
jgi:hypothetical protein